MHQSEVVAVINTSPDTIQLLRDVLQHAGMTVVSGYTFDFRDGKLNLDAFVQQHDPKVIVYDIAPPYDVNFQLFEHARSLASMKGRHFLITSVNVTHVETLVGKDERVYEVVGHPLDPSRIVQAVKEASRAGPTS